MADLSGERRRAPRVTSCNLVHCEEVDSLGMVRSALMGRTLDLSDIGAKVELLGSRPDDLPRDGELWMTLALRDELVRVRGRVAYEEEAGARVRRLGVEFRGIAPAECGVLASFVGAVSA
ncbi:MAG: PilZ domain-containing protein [Planctomycetota bacterium]